MSMSSPIAMLLSPVASMVRPIKTLLLSSLPVASIDPIAIVRSPLITFSRPTTLESMALELTVFSSPKTVEFVAATVFFMPTAIALTALAI